MKQIKDYLLSAQEKDAVSFVSILTMSFASGFLMLIASALLLQEGNILIYAFAANVLIKISCGFLCLKHKYKSSGFLLMILFTADSLFAHALAGSAVLMFFTVMFLVEVPFCDGRVRVVFGIVDTYLAMASYLGLPNLYFADILVDGLSEKQVTTLNTFQVMSSFLLLFLLLLSHSWVVSYLRRQDKSQIKSLQSKAYTDKLTLLPNRYYCYLIFENFHKINAGKWCIAMADLDDFKSVNDNYGHDVGDKVLKITANKIRSVLRHTDYAFRWGGEEIVLLINCDLENAARVTEQVRLQMANSEEFVKLLGRCQTISIGVSPFNPEEPEKSLKSADEGCYAAKKAGKNRVVKNCDELLYQNE
jgi:diguanylate cyclase (GGDEF)-like protein